MLARRSLGRSKIDEVGRNGRLVPLQTETGEIWNGAGEPPPINSPLYLPIVTEIQERTGAPLGEIAVGEPWATHLPTPLVILRPDDDLPRWRRPDPQVWEWREVGA